MKNVRLASRVSSNSLPCDVSLSKTQNLSSIHIQTGHGSGGGVRVRLVVMWDRSSAQPHFLHIPHSAWDTDCSLKKILLRCWTSMCKIYHGGVRNFNLCFQNRLALRGPNWGASRIPLTFFRPLGSTTLCIPPPLVLHLFHWGLGVGLIS